MIEREARKARVAIAVICVLSCVCWSALSWSAALFFEGATRQFLLVLLGLAYLSAMPFYFLVRQGSSPALPWFMGAVLVSLLVLVTPSFLQTDQLRYLWDGLQSSVGVNPFRMSPKEAIAPLGVGAPPWTAFINHPELNTIYPPGAQISFLIGTFLNPIFASEAVFEWFRPWLADAPRTFFWPYELGWRCVVASCVFWTVLLLRRARWDLLVFHPLFLLVVVMNVHVDALLLPFLVLLFRPVNQSSVSGLVPGLALGMGVLVRWTPALFIPALFISWKRHLGARFALGAFAVAGMLVTLGIALYWRGAEGQFLTSTKVYGAHWMFFGYLHRILADGMGWLGLVDNRIFFAKVFLALGFVVFSCVVLRCQARRMFSLRLTCLLLMSGALAISPTLHPWYLLVLLCLGLPYMKTLRFPWVWPLLAPASYAFYWKETDPVLVRFLVYGVVSVCLFLDFRRLFRPRVHCYG